MAPTPESVSSGPTRSRIILFVLLIGVIFLLLSLAAYLVARVRRLSRKANPERYAQPLKTSPPVDPVPVSEEACRVPCYHMNGLPICSTVRNFYGSISDSARRHSI